MCGNNTRLLCPGHTRAMVMGPKGQGARLGRGPGAPWAPWAPGPWAPGPGPMPLAQAPWPWPGPHGLCVAWTQSLVLFPHKKHLPPGPESPPPGQNPCLRARIRGPWAPIGPNLAPIAKKMPPPIAIGALGPHRAHKRPPLGALGPHRAHGALGPHGAHGALWAPWGPTWTHSV